MEIFTTAEILEMKATIEGTDVSREPDRQELKESLLEKMYAELTLRQKQHAEDYPVIVGEGKTQFWML
jgi:hypothetical protein